jgi:predicted amino acid racemase
MDRYPLLEFNLKKLYHNTEIVTKLCENYGIKVAGIIKGFGGIPEGAEEMAKGGCYQIGSSRIDQLRVLKERGFDVPLLLVRIPMMCEIEDVVKYSDLSLVSEKETLDLLNSEAKKQDKVYGVVLMYDLGDLREGVFLKEDLIKLALYVEYDLNNLYLEGIGTNLSCYGSVAPSTENLNRLAEAATEIEEKLNRNLNIVSGGGTTTYQPSKALTRGEAVKIIYEIIDNENIEYGFNITNYDETYTSAVVVGNLNVLDSVGRGNVNIKNVVVLGDIVISAKNVKSVVLTDVKARNIIVESDTNPVKIVYNDNVTIGNSSLPAIVTVQK